MVDPQSGERGRRPRRSRPPPRRRSGDPRTGDRRGGRRRGVRTAGSRGERPRTSRLWRRRDAPGGPLGTARDRRDPLGNRDGDRAHARGSRGDRRDGNHRRRGRDPCTERNGRSERNERDRRSERRAFRRQFGHRSAGALCDPGRDGEHLRDGHGDHRHRRGVFGARRRRGTPARRRARGRRAVHEVVYCGADRRYEFGHVRRTQGTLRLARLRHHGRQARGGFRPARRRGRRSGSRGRVVLER